MNIESVMAECNNYFAASTPHSSEWKIEDGAIELPFLANGQYFRIEGSVFNDGVYCYPSQLEDEIFYGRITPLAVPKAFIDLCEEITAFEAASVGIGPYTSESFGGYSYQKAAGAGGGGITWQEAFRVKLRRWRKI